MRAALIFFISLITFAYPPLASGSATNPSPIWGLNDVSILLPFPTMESQNVLLRADSQGSFGALIPASSYKTVPPLSFFSREEDYATLRAIGFRIDPCFPGLVEATNCRPQVRIVWQPFTSVPKGSPLNSIDAGIHTFYELNSEEFASLLRELQVLKEKYPHLADQLSPHAALSVHPIAKLEGLEGPFVRNLHSIFLKYIGAKKLSRLTFMLVRGPSILWSFGGFDVPKLGSDEPEIESMMIPRIDPTTVAKLQTFFNRSNGGDDFSRSEITPRPEGNDLFTLLMLDSTLIDPVKQRAEIVESIDSIFRIENPRFHTPESVDCVSCHVAGGARNFAFERFPELAAEASPAKFSFRSEWNLTNESPVKNNTRNLRAFGYFGRDAAISQRVINESAEVARVLTEAQR